MMDDPWMAAVRQKKRGTAAADRLINRELSFLDYVARLIALARDPSLPLLERVKFCSIVSTMLDEFFMVRIAGLNGQAAAGIVVRSPDGRTAQQTLRESRAQVLELQAEQADVWSGELCPALAAEGIAISGVDGLPDKERAELERRYERDIYPVLTPLAVGPGQPFPYISGLSISLAVFVRDPESALPFASRATRSSRSPTRPTISSRRWSSSCAAAASVRSRASRCRLRCRPRCASGSSRACASATSSSIRSRARSISQTSSS
jgi:hypothetical protein